ncbi:MAG: acyl-CoA dehydrogenase family protein [Streptosporangiaceae bacterium]
MDFSQNYSHLELSSLVRRILTDHATPDRLSELEQDGVEFDLNLWRVLAGAGVLAAAGAEDAGGDGLGLAAQCAVLAELGRAVAPVPYLDTIVLGAGAVAGFGSAEQMRRWAAPAVGGDLVIAVALAEPGGADPRRPVTRAERGRAGGWRLTGTKTAVPAGTAAGLFLIPAATAGGTAVFAVERSDPGVTVLDQRVTGGRAAQLDLAGTELGDDRRIGEPGPALPGWLADRATIGRCALQLGVAERALELTAEHARTREQFGRPIGAFQAVAQRLADAYIDVEAIRLTMWQAAWRLETGRPAGQELATAKFWAADGGHRVAHTAVHVHGGMGIDISHPLHRYFTAAKANEFAMGGATAQLRQLGALLASPDPT